MPEAALQILLTALQEAPQIVSLAEAEIATLRASATPEQQAAIDAALDAAHTKLQEATPASGE